MNKKRKCDKNTPQYNNPHIRINREIGQQVLASIEDGWTDTHTHTDRRTNFIYIDLSVSSYFDCVYDKHIRGSNIILWNSKAMACLTFMPELYLRFDSHGMQKEGWVHMCL